MLFPAVSVWKAPPGVSEEISAWEVGGLRVIRSLPLIYGQDGKRLGAVAWRTRGPSKRRL